MKHVELKLSFRFVFGFAGWRSFFSRSYRIGLSWGLVFSSKSLLSGLLKNFYYLKRNSKSLLGDGAAGLTRLIPIICPVWDLMGKSLRPTSARLGSAIEVGDLVALSKTFSNSSPFTF